MSPGSYLLSVALVVGLTGTLMAELYPKIGTIQISLSGVESNQGQIVCLVYDKRDRWMKESKAVFRTSVPAKKGNMSFGVEAALNKRYAITVYHDENQNGKLDTGAFIPKPTEPVGASHFSGSSIPRFYDCSFRFNEEPLTVEVTLQRP